MLIADYFVIIRVTNDSIRQYLVDEGKQVCKTRTNFIFNHPNGE